MSDRQAAQSAAAHCFSEASRFGAAQRIHKVLRERTAASLAPRPHRDQGALPDRCQIGASQLVGRNRVSASALGSGRREGRLPAPVQSGNILAMAQAKKKHLEPRVL